MNATTLKCNCENAQQDKLHGTSRRVHNKTSKKRGDKAVYRCTTCRTERTE